MNPDLHSDIRDKHRDLYRDWYAMTCSETYKHILSDTLNEDYWRFNKTFSYLLTDIFSENYREKDTKNGFEI